VVLKLTGCPGEKLSGDRAEVVNCKGNEATASALSETRLYRVSLSRTEENFGNGTWAVAGKIARLRRNDIPKDVAETAEPAPSPSALPVAVVPAVASAPAAPAPVASAPSTSEVAKFKVSGFIDAQFQTLLSDSNSPGFVVQDGALYLSHSLGNGEAKLDLPFQMLGTGGNSNFAFANAKAQAYLTHACGSHITAKIGQWDTPYGVEVNDTADNFFSRQGLVYATNPVVHTGALLAYAPNDRFTANFFAANPHDTGNANGKNLEYGTQWSLGGPVRASVGAMLTRLKGTSITNHYYDGTLGATFGKFSLDFEANFLRTSDAPLYDRRYLALLVANFTDRYSFGVRAEYADLKENTATSQSVQKQTELFVGPQIVLTPASRVRADFTWDHTDVANPGSNDRMQTGVDVSWVYRLDP
jgi:hypothetical protein